MRQALPEMVIVTEAQSGDAAEQHLNPADQRHRLAHHPMTDDNERADAAMKALGEMQLEVHTEYDLQEQHEHEGIRKGGMDVSGKLPALMGMAQEIGDNGDDGAEGLNRDVPATPHDLPFHLKRLTEVSSAFHSKRRSYPENHPQRENNAKGQDHQDYVHPKRRILPRKK